ncbi:peroxisome proliferator-activated receptor gamma coactivator 1-alpha-like isoform X2 [Acanthaster planci]|uniref:Peroxisome proliferator-activated receptor gamma coactivator 1-alpha-like isoform X2 n=1 Tax=Acanthaster planci TaxID=133434 RepID=A0A8B7YEX1_ACAPL|nr:peroxisome proliferator-activated receptor gamma coactivator 1-alpha-like isoform X2 [Acanthaster planci]
MEEEPEDLSSLHYQILFPPREPSHQRREYELEQHIALMDEPAQVPPRKALDMEDFNLTIEHLTSRDKHETEERFLLMEEEQKCEKDMLDIGIEANDLGSLLQKFEQTEATVLTNSAEGGENSQIKSKSSRLQDPRNLAKKISPVKRKSTILLEPLAMPSKRLRAKDTNLLTTERDCVSLPGSRTSSPGTVQHEGLSVICSADQGFDYLVMDHDYCSISNGQNVNPSNSVSSSPLNDSSNLSVEERKAVYKQKYKIRKKGKKVGRASGGRRSDKSNDGVVEPVHLMNKLPEYIQPLSELTVPAKTCQTGKLSEEKKTDIVDDNSMEEQNCQGNDTKPAFFDKIPDYFLGKHMYQEISKVEEEEARKKEEEMTQLKEKDETEKLKQTEDNLKEHRRHRHRSRHHGRHRGRNERKIANSVDDTEKDVNREKTVNAVTVQVIESSGGNNEDVKENRQCGEDSHSPANEQEGISNGYEYRKTSYSERHSRCRSHSARSSLSRSSSRSSSRGRSLSSYSSCSSFSRTRRRRDSRHSYTLSSSSSRSRSRSCSRSFKRHRRRRYSTYSSASRSSSSSRSRSRSHSRSRHWRPRSRSTSSSMSRRRSRSGSYDSVRSHSCESDRRWRSSSRSHRRRHSRSRSRRRMRSVSIERSEKRKREERMKEQQEQWADRRVVYIGRIPYGTTRNTLRKRFGKFGEIERITLHFRDVGDNYAFVTYVYKCDAYAAVEGANKDYNEPEYDICFGGRRQFCKADYEDLDSMGQEEMALEFGYKKNPSTNQSEDKMETEFDRLLREAMKKSKR